MNSIIKQYIQAGFAGIYLVTHEEIRAEAMLREITSELNYGLHIWSITRGLVTPATGSIQPVLDPVEAVSAANDLGENNLLALVDFHQFLDTDAQGASPLLTRTMRDTLRHVRTAGKVIVIMAPVLKLPPELEKEFAVVNCGLPGVDVLSTIATGIASSAELELTAPELAAVSEAALGLTTTEAEDIFALSVVRKQQLDADLIAQEKAQALGKNGLLELKQAHVAMDEIGGLENLKQWLQRRRHAFGQAAKDYGLPLPKGVLILGIPGTGKSLTAFAVADILKRPILRLDAGRLFAGLVGASEANLRQALNTAEAIAPCVLMIDELEKAFAGSSSSGASDGGTAARVFGTFLSWMQDHSAPVFVVATANDISALPPELLRKGRFDELFFVDLPQERDRQEIWRIHLDKRRRDPGNFDVNALAAATDTFTGAEIEQVIIDAMFECFDCGVELTQAALRQAIDQTVPLATTMAEQVNHLRHWASNRARSASVDRRPNNSSGTRRLAA